MQDGMRLADDLVNFIPGAFYSNGKLRSVSV